MWRYAESTQDFVDIARHRKGDGFCNGVECNCETNIGGAGPVDFDIVQELKGGNEVISALWEAFTHSYRVRSCVQTRG